MNKRMVNITFQIDPTGKQAWENAPVVYVLRNVPADMNTGDICDAISATHGNCVVRSARLFLDDEITSKRACRYNGGYYQSTYKPVN